MALVQFKAAVDSGKSVITALFKRLFDALPGWLQEHLTHLQGWFARQKKLNLYILAGAGVLGSVLLRRTYIHRRMKKQRCHRIDAMGQVYQIMHKWNVKPTINGLQVCDDSLTLDDGYEIVEFLYNSFINFRCIPVFEYNSWWLQEQAEGEFDRDFHCEYINMDEEKKLKNEREQKSDSDGYEMVDGAHDDENAVERVLQEALNMMNDENDPRINLEPEWDEYTEKGKPNWKAYYLHWPSLKKCLVFWQISHVYLDGISMSSVFQIAFEKQFGTDNDGKIRSILLKMAEQRQTFRSPSLIDQIKYYSTAPFSILLFLKQALWDFVDDPTCAVSGGVIKDRRQKLAISRPLSLKDFKRTAKEYNATVNELFATLVSRTLRTYMLKNRESDASSDSTTAILWDPSWNGIFRCVGALSTRPLDPEGFAGSFELFAEEGTNGNCISTMPVFVPIRDASIVETRSKWNVIKQTYYPMVAPLTAAVLTSLPLPLWLLEEIIFNTAFGTTSMVSNLIGPTRKFPLKQGKTIDMVYGSASTACFPLNFTLLSIEDEIRLGLTVNSGVIKKHPRELIDIFSGEYELFKSGQGY